VAQEFATLARAHLEAALEPGEQLWGVIAANRAKTFSGALYAIGVTDRRLLLQPLDRRIQPKGELEALGPDRIASMRVSGAGDGWWTATEAILDYAAITLRLETRDGEKYKLMLMRIGSGDSQRQGVAALGDWAQRCL
jgi:hypothetical protein